jgi:hypothetical protein
MKTIRHILLIPVYLWCLAYTAIGAPVTLEWDASDHATSYEVWRGIELLTIVTSPSVHLDLPTNTRTTLTVRAVNTSGESDFSSPIVAVPVTPRSTHTLSNWQDQPVFFAEERSGRLFQIGRAHV